MRRSILMLAALIGAASCSQSAEQPAANSAAANTAEPEKKRPTYCFFKNADTKGWAALRDRGGNILVKGQARIADRRNMAANTTGTGAPGDWWDVSAAVPASAPVTSVTVLCGKKTIAELELNTR